MDGVGQCGVLSGEERWERGNGEQRDDGVGPGGFIPPVVDAVLVVSTFTDWAAVRCFLSGVVS
jgi:hypothetical protein